MARPLIVLVVAALLVMTLVLPWTRARSDPSSTREAPAASSRGVRKPAEVDVRWAPGAPARPGWSSVPALVTVLGGAGVLAAWSVLALLRSGARRLARQVLPLAGSLGLVACCWLIAGDPAPALGPHAALIVFLFVALLPYARSRAASEAAG